MTTKKNPLPTVPEDSIITNSPDNGGNDEEQKNCRSNRRTKNGHTKNEMEQEIDTLRRKLKSAQFALAQTQTQMELQKIRTRQIIMAWKLRIHEADEKVRRQRLERDLELKEITTQLLFFEGQLKKEQNDIKQMLEEKDMIIDGQQRKIRELETRNDALYRELSDFKKNLPNGLHVSFSEEDSRNISFAKENSIAEDVFIESPLVDPRGDNSSYKSATDSPNRRKKLRSSAAFYRTLSLPNCIDIDDPHEDIVYNDSNMSKGSSQYSLDMPVESDKNSNYISRASPRVVGRREKTYPVSSQHKNLTNVNNNNLRTNQHLAQSQPNLISSSAARISRLSRSQMTIPKEDKTASDAELSRSKSRSQDLVSDQEKKSESPRDRIKRAFMRPRDVKKKSKMRTRSNSMKENDPEAKKLSHSKRHLSFAF